FVFDDLETGAIADDGAGAVLDLPDAADVHPDGAEELERAAPWRGLGAAEHDAEFFADLGGEEADALRFVADRGQPAHGLAHEARLGADGRVAHLAFKFGARNQGGNGVDDNDLDSVRADQRFGYIEGIFAGIRLGDEQVVEVDAQDLRVARVERVFDIDESRQAAVALDLGDQAEGERGFTGRFRSVNFGDAAHRQTADAESEVDGERAG